MVGMFTCVAVGCSTYEDKKSGEQKYNYLLLNGYRPEGDPQALFSSVDVLSYNSSKQLPLSFMSPCTALVDIIQGKDGVYKKVLELYQKKS